jgi:hypothetical protein
MWTAAVTFLSEHWQMHLRHQQMTKAGVAEVMVSDLEVTLQEKSV